MRGHVGMSMSGQNMDHSPVCKSTPRKRSKKEQKEMDKKFENTIKLRKKMEEVFKASCYTHENGWIKPRNFDSIMHDVISKTIDYLRKLSLL